MKEKHLEDIINKMFDIAGVDLSYRSVLGKDGWFLENEMTNEQCDEWISWGSEYLYKNKVYTKARAKKQMHHLNLMYGLKIKNNGNKEKEKEV